MSIQLNVPAPAAGSDCGLILIGNETDSHYRKITIECAPRVLMEQLAGGFKTTTSIGPGNECFLHEDKANLTGRKDKLTRQMSPLMSYRSMINVSRRPDGRQVGLMELRRLVLPRHRLPDSEGFQAGVGENRIYPEEVWLELCKMGDCWLDSLFPMVVNHVQQIHEFDQRIWL